MVLREIDLLGAIGVGYCVCAAIQIGYITTAPLSWFTTPGAVTAGVTLARGLQYVVEWWRKKHSTEED